MGLNTGIEIRNPSGTTFLTPDNSICRIIDKIWVVFGQQPICMNNNYAFENYLDDDEGLKQAKKTAMKQYLLVLVQVCLGLWAFRVNRWLEFALQTNI